MKNIVFIWAQNDDAEIFAWWTLLKHLDNWDRVYICIFDAWNIVRQKEQTLADKISKFKSFYFKSEEDLKHIIEKISPDIIITHRYDDTHPDHKMVSNLALNVMKYVKVQCKKKFLSFFCNTHNGFWLNGEFEPTIYIDISNYYNKKKEIINCFISENPVYRNKKAESITKWYWNRCDRKHVEWFRKFNYLGLIDCEDLLS